MRLMRDEKEQVLGLLEMIEHISRFYRRDGMKMMTMVEVGTYLGESAEIFSHTFRRVLTCDPWILPFMQGYDEKEVTLKELKELLSARIGKLDNVEFFQMPGALLAQMVPDRSVDFVYIDAWHRVLPASLDIVTWLPKLIPNRFIGGHDYRTKDYSEVIPAVRYVLGEPDVVFRDSSWLKFVPGGNLL